MHITRAVALTSGYACLFETAQENPGKFLEFLGINPKKSREFSENSFVFLCETKKNPRNSQKFTHTQLLLKTQQGAIK